MHIVKVTSTAVIGVFLGGFLGVLVAFGWLMSFGVVSGALELCCWNKIIISNHSALFFANLLMIGGFGGYLSSRVKRKDLKILILIATYSLVFLMGFILQNSLPFRF